ncbi:NTP transferase domain-containing protein [Halorubrum luteum]
MGDPVATRPSEPGITDAVLLCGGRGTRLGTETEKPLVPVDGRPMVHRVLDAIARSRIRRVVAVSSPHTPSTTATMEELSAGELEPARLVSNVVVGSGEGYVDDLNRGLDAVDGPALTVTADLPLLRTRDVADVIEAAVGSDDDCGSAHTANDRGLVDSVSICVPVSLKRTLGASVDTSVTHDGNDVAPTGLNVVGSGEDTVVVRRSKSLAINVNRPRDLALARRIASE